MRPVAVLSLVSALLGGALVAGCLTNPPPVEFEPEPLPTLEAAPTTPARDLPGVDTAALSDREKQSWWRLVSRLYAPCPDQAVSLAQCVDEARDCAGCVPLARFVAARVKAGDSTADAETAAAARFGPDVRAIDVADSPSKGPATAPVTIVAWSDFECPACARMMPILDEIAAKHANQVRLVHKFYPLSKHPNAHKAALAAWAAQRQGKYWEYEKKIFADQTRVTEGDLVAHARELGLDLKKFDADRASDAAEKAVARDKAAADASGLSGTPHVMINGRRFVAWEDPAKDLEAWVALELELVAGRKAPATVAAPATAPPAAPAP
jgi:protein-disulfide isomerase